MSKIKDYKITDTTGKKVSDVPGDKLTGTVAQNKEVFDKLGELIIDKVNDAFDYMSDQGVDDLPDDIGELDDKINDEVDRLDGRVNDAEDDIEAVDGKADTNAGNITALNTRVDSLQAAVGTPLSAATVADMTNHDKIYVYTGSEDGYTSGNWYYWDGAAWTSGGDYNSTAFVTDTTLTLAGKAADAKKVGDEVTDLKEDLSLVSNDVTDINFIERVLSDKFKIGSIYVGSYPWTYTYSTVRICTKEGYTISLKQGDKVCLKDYTTYRLFIGYYDGTTDRHTSWIGSDWTAPYDCEAVVTISKIIEETVTSIADYLTQFFIKKAGYDNKIITERINDLLTQKDFSMLFELGNINMSTVPPTYGNSTSRIRTLRWNSIPLKMGDIITMDNFSDYYMYVGWKNASGTWNHYTYWINEAYTATEDGDYILLIRNVTETTITDIDSISSKLKIKRAANVYDEVYPSINKVQRRNYFVKSINHRGYNRLFPENTLIAFKKSAELGFWGVETDVRFTSDNVPVLLHDQTINRTARNADGTIISETINIADITYQQALTYDFGISMGTKFAGTKIPTFEQFMKLCRKLSITPYVELKTGNVSSLVAIAKSCGMLKNTTWISSARTLLENVINIDQTARVGMVMGEVTSGLIEEMQSLKTGKNEVFADVLISYVTASSVNLLITADIPLEVYTPDDPETMNEMDAYCTGMTSDYYVAGIELYNLNIE